MPESPEVQVLAEYLDARLAGRRILAIDLIEYRAAKTPSDAFSSLVGQRIGGVVRRGKHLDVAVGSGHLVISLGRHGWVRLQENGADEPGSPPALVRITLDDGAVISVTDAGDWVSAGISLVPDAHDVPALAKLGPDPLASDYDDASLRSALGRRKQVRALLQEQETIAGIGGAYSDEILHSARIPPLIRASELDHDARERLMEATVTVLRGASPRGGELRSRG